MGLMVCRRGRFWVFTMALIISACGGGGGGGTPAQPPILAPSPPPSGDVGGAIELDANINLPSPFATIGMAANGDAIVVWQRKESTSQFRVVARRYTNQGWGDVETIDAVDAGSKDAYSPSIAMNASGRAVVVWVQGNSDISSFDAGSIWVKTFDPVTGWGSASPLTSTTNQLLPMDYPKVAINADGAAFVLWTRAVGGFTNTTVYARRLRAGQTVWDAQSVLDETTEAVPRELRHLHLIMDDAGNALAFWRYYTRHIDGVLSGVFNLTARHFSVSSNSWQSPLELAVDVNDSGDSIDAVMVGVGHAIVAWEAWDGDQSGNSRSVTLARTFRNGVWETPTDLGVGFSPRITTGGGKAVLANAIVSPGEGVVAAAREYRAASGWGGQSNLDDPTALSGLVLVDANTAGQTMALWTRLNGTTSAPERLYTNYHNGVSWQGSATVLAGSANGDLPLDIKLDDNGNAIAIWRRGTTLWANRFAVP